MRTIPVGLAFGWQGSALVLLRGLDRDVSGLSWDVSARWLAQAAAQACGADGHIAQSLRPDTLPSWAWRRILALNTLAGASALPPPPFPQAELRRVTSPSTTPHV